MAKVHAVSFIYKPGCPGLSDGQRAASPPRTHRESGEKAARYHSPLKGTQTLRRPCDPPIGNETALAAW